jgi:hypothetical protein
VTASQQQVSRVQDHTTSSSYNSHTGMHHCPHSSQQQQRLASSLVALALMASSRQQHVTRQAMLQS